MPNEIEKTTVGSGVLYKFGSAETCKERRAGLMIAVIGVCAAIGGTQYGIGTLNHVGPGLFPTVLGVILASIGLAIVITATSGQGGGVGVLDHSTPDKPVDWRGWAAIVGGVVLFVLLTPVLGLVPGTFACVFTSAMGDRKMTVLSSAVLAAVVSAAGALLFVWGLQIGLPYFGS